jgi:hypothetical protein
LIITTNVYEQKEVYLFLTHSRNKTKLTCSKSRLESAGKKWPSVATFMAAFAA